MKRNQLFAAVLCIIFLSACTNNGNSMYKTDSDHSEHEGTSHETTPTYDVWLEEQSELAKEFYFDNEALFADIAQAALADEITEVYQYYFITTDDADQLSVVEYQKKDEIRVHQGSGVQGISVSDISPGLEQALTEFYHSQGLSPTLVYDQEWGPLQLAYATGSWEGGGILAEVLFRCAPEQIGGTELGNNWYLQADYHFMAGL